MADAFIVRRGGSGSGSGSGSTDASILYQNGNQNTAVTGGWAAYADPRARAMDLDGTGFNSVKPGLTDDGSLKITISGNAATGTVRTVNKVDLTKYDTLTIAGTIGLTHPYTVLYLTQSVTSSDYYMNAPHVVAIDSNGGASISLDGVTGSWYVCIGIYVSSASYTVSSVLLS